MSGKCGSDGDSTMKKDKGPCPSAGSQKSKSTTMANNSESKSNECGCGSGSNTKKDKCSSGGSEKKSGFSKTPCKTPGAKGKCHESHEQFKKKPETEEGCSSGKDSTVAKCSTSYREFTRSVGGESPCAESSQSECHGSYKKFQESKLEDCSDSREVEAKQEPQLKSVPCPAQKKQEPCSGSTDSHKTVQETKKDCQSQTKRGPCSSSVDFFSEKKESPCASKSGKPGDGSMSSKITSRCKEMVKDFVKPKSKSKCSGVDEPSQKDSICNKTAPTGLPCSPKTEKGAGYAQPCCTSKVTCAEPKMPSWADFFPLDARNQKLNACIDKYSKIDPGQVISRCSQFANQPLGTSESCKQQQEKTKQLCVSTQRDVNMPEPARKSVVLISPHARTLLTRWAPSAALYLSTAALVTLYLTEWKAVPVYLSDTEELDKDAKSK